MPKEGIPSPSQCCDVATLIRECCTTVACAPADQHKAEVEALMRRLLPNVALEDFKDTPVNARGYARKLLYTHPSGYFSVLQLQWQPGARTPIHGHNAWGCVGVISGEIGCDTFECCEEAEGGVAQTGSIAAGVGAIATVDPNPKGIHSLFNPTDKVATTLHIYGMDLKPNPCAINVPYEKGGHTHRA